MKVPRRRRKKGQDQDRKDEENVQKKSETRAMYNKSKTIFDVLWTVHLDIFAQSE
jgi:hypothetical protein